MKYTWTIPNYFPEREMALINFADKLSRDSIDSSRQGSIIFPMLFTVQTLTRHMSQCKKFLSADFYNGEFLQYL